MGIQGCVGKPFSPSPDPAGAAQQMPKLGREVVVAGVDDMLHVAHEMREADPDCSRSPSPNTRRVRRALAALFGGAVGKDTVSRVWRKVKGDWDVWNGRSLAGEPIIRLILDGTVVRVRLDKKSTSISLLVALGVRQDGQKVLLAVKGG